MHEDLQARTDFECANPHADRLEVSQAGIQEVQAGEVKILHLIEVDHALLDLLVPAQPSLLLLLQLLQHLLPLDRVVLPVHSHKVAVERDGLSNASVTMMSLGVSLALE